MDDEKLERVLIRNSFDWEKEDFQILGEASNGEEALEFFDINQPDVVLTDINMPYMDGVNLAGEIRKRSANFVCVNISFPKKAMLGRDHSEELSKKENKRRSQFEKQIMKYVDEHATCQVAFNHYKDSIVLLYNTELEEILEEVFCLKEELEQRISSALAVSVSEKQDGYEGISRAYKQAEQAMNASFVLNCREIITYNEYEQIRTI